MKSVKSLEARLASLEERVRILENRTPILKSVKDDPLLPHAIEITLKMRKTSTSHIQRKLMIGYARAAALIDEMEKQGYVGPPMGSGKPRNILKK